jgi:hypothetical protein
MNPVSHDRLCVSGPVQGERRKEWKSHSRCRSTGWGSVRRHAATCGNVRKYEERGAAGSGARINGRGRGTVFIGARDVSL